MELTDTHYAILRTIGRYGKAEHGLGEFFGRRELDELIANGYVFTQRPELPETAESRFASPSSMGAVEWHRTQRGHDAVGIDDP